MSNSLPTKREVADALVASKLYAPLLDVFKVDGHKVQGTMEGWLLDFVEWFPGTDYPTFMIHWIVYTAGNGSLAQRLKTHEKLALIILLYEYVYGKYDESGG